MVERQSSKIMAKEEITCCIFLRLLPLPPSSMFTLCWSHFFTAHTALDSLIYCSHCIGFLSSLFTQCWSHFFFAVHTVLRSSLCCSHCIGFTSLLFTLYCLHLFAVHTVLRSSLCCSHCIAFISFLFTLHYHLFPPLSRLSCCRSSSRSPC